ncbi:hypothetical protein [Paraconexibacter algicola]|uniref:DUF4303 domain-containing protein n=1 Tax=Paraconexibacter algicola TaxID=2133960 RepID=A0A2T4UGL5_9ACTN|nr:hypothetical protein [Paraconexibacter algicola]PTL58393.1 hypothetical protein C7Y72_01375 [Paraconexibacter algicola]
MAQQYADVPLSGQAHDAVRTLVDGYVEILVALLRTAEQDAPFAAVGLDAGQEGLDVVPNIALATEADLEALFAQDPTLGWFYVWNAWEYSDVVEPSPGTPPPAVIDAWRIVQAELDGNVVDPVLWTLVRVAHALNRQTLPVALTADATVFAFDEGGGDSQVDALEFGTPADVLDRLRRRGYVAREAA